MRQVEIRDGSIRLGQFLKLADVVDVGSEVKELLDSGEIEVNGEPETRRGRQLVPGDLVSVGDTDLQVVSGGTAG